MAMPQMGGFNPAQLGLSGAGGVAAPQPNNPLLSGVMSQLSGLQLPGLESAMGLNPIGMAAFGMTAPSSISSLFNTGKTPTPAAPTAAPTTPATTAPTGSPTPLPPNPGTQIDPATGRIFTIPGTDIPFDPAVQIGNLVGDPNIPSGRD